MCDNNTGCEHTCEGCANRTEVDDEAQQQRIAILRGKLIDSMDRLCDDVIARVAEAEAYKVDLDAFYAAVPSWSVALNNFYNVILAPVDRFLDRVGAFIYNPIGRLFVPSAD